MLVGRTFLIVEIFANRPLANSIGHAQDSLRRAQAAAGDRLRPHRFVPGGGCGSLEEDVPDLTFPPGDEASIGLDVVSVSASDSGVGAAVQTRPGACFYVHLQVGAGRSLRRRDGVHRRGRAARERSPLVRWRLGGGGAIDELDRVDDIDGDAEYRAAPARSCIVQPGLPEATTVAPVEATASAFSRISRPDISGSVTL